MKTPLTKELPSIAMVLLPFVYLAYIWNSLPEEVPIHWNGQGEIDAYGARATLILIPVLLSLLVYVLFLVMPRLDPKKKLAQMGSKYQSLKLLMVTMMSLLAIFIIYSSKEASITNLNYMFVGVGVLYIILGNFMKTIRPNYFLGIRTPWTLENETVWKDTHKLAGKIWFIGGLVIVAASMLLAKEHSLPLFIVITGILVMVPLVYSYVRFQQVKAVV